MLDEQLQLKLSPAYDIAYSYKPRSPWVNSHWMRLNGKQDNFSREDFYGFRKISPIFTKRKIDRVIEETIAHFSTWKRLAAEHDVPQPLIKLIDRNLQLTI